MSFWVGKMALPVKALSTSTSSPWNPQGERKEPTPIMQAPTPSSEFKIILGQQEGSAGKDTCCKALNLIFENSMVGITNNSGSHFVSSYC